MYISKKQKIRIIENRNIQKQNIDIPLLVETLHIFNGQVEAAGVISKMVMYALMKGLSKISVDISEYIPTLKVANLNIKANNIYNPASASLEQISPGEYIEIGYNIYADYKNLIVSGKEKRLEQAIKEVTIHELSHAYFTSQKYTNGGVIDSLTTDEYYENIRQYLHDGDSIGLEYDFAYAVYSVIRQELYAFVSQCYGGLLDYLSTQSMLDMECVKKGLSNNEIYNIYTQNLNTLNAIKQMSKDKKELFIKSFEKELDKPGLFKNVETFNKYLLYLTERTKDALKRCGECAVRAYYKLKK